MDLRLLAALEVIRLERETSSGARRDVALAVGDLCSAAGFIPVGGDDVEIWVQAVMSAIIKKSNRDIKTKSGLDVRIQTLKRIIKIIDHYPLVFRKWLNVSSILQSRIDFLKKSLISSFEKLESYEPLTKTEIVEELSNQNNFEGVCTVLMYLSSGLRPGELEKLKREFLIKGRLLLNKIVSKTETDRSPVASALFRACFAWLNFKVTLCDTKLEKKRFRPTCAVNNLQSGVTSLEVMEKLGHANQSMINNHYAKMLPKDWGNAKNATEYFGVNKVSINGRALNENAWENYLAYLSLVNASRFNVKNFKELFLRELGEEINDQILAVADF